eukprot:gene4999-6946_t
MTSCEYHQLSENNLQTKPTPPPTTTAAQWQHQLVSQMTDTNVVSVYVDDFVPPETNWIELCLGLLMWQTGRFLHPRIRTRVSLLWGKV